MRQNSNQNAFYKTFEKMSFPGSAANAAFFNISKLHNGRQTNLGNYTGGGELISSDDEIDTTNPIFDIFIKAGESDGILKNTNCSLDEIHQIFGSCSNYLKSNWAVDREKRTSYTNFNSFVYDACCNKI